MIKPGKKIVLLPYEPQDWPNLYKWYYSGEYEEFFRDIDHAPNAEYFQAYARLRNGFSFLVKRLGVDEVVGMVMVYEVKAVTFQAHFAMLIDKKYQREYFGLEAIYLTMKHLFEDLDLRKMVIEVLAENEDLIRYMTMYDIPMEANLVQEAKISGEYKDVCRFSIFKEHGKEILKKIGEFYANQSSIASGGRGDSEGNCSGERCGRFSEYGLWNGQQA